MQSKKNLVRVLSLFLVSGCFLACGPRIQTEHLNSVSSFPADPWKGALIPEHEDSTSHIVLAVSPLEGNLGVAIAIAQQLPEKVKPVFVISGQSEAGNNVNQIRERIRKDLRRDAIVMTGNFGTNLPWTRDYMPLTVRFNDGSIGLIGFRYDGIGLADLPSDDTRPEDSSLGVLRFRRLIIDALGLPYRELPLSLEGVNLAINSGGLCLTSSKILHQTRKTVAANGQWSDFEFWEITPEEARQQLITAGVCRDLLLLEPLASEETKHVDLFVKFMNDTIVAMAKPAGRDGDILRANRAKLESAGLTVVELPNPQEIEGIAAVSYTDSLIVGDRILVPEYVNYELPADTLVQLMEADDSAKTVYESLGFDVRGISASMLAPFGGTVHSATMDLHLAAPVFDNFTDKSVLETFDASLTDAQALLAELGADARLLMIGQAGHYTTSGFQVLKSYLEAHKEDRSLRNVLLEVDYDLDEFLKAASIGSLSQETACAATRDSAEIAYLLTDLLPALQAINRGRPEQPILLRGVDGATEANAAITASKVETGSCWSRFNGGDISYVYTTDRERATADNVAAILGSLAPNDRAVGIFHLAHLVRGIEACAFTIIDLEAGIFRTDWSQLTWLDRISEQRLSVRTAFIDEEHPFYHNQGVFRLTYALRARSSHDDFAYPTAPFADLLSLKGLDLLRPRAYLKVYLDEQNRSGGQLKDLTDGVIHIRHGATKNLHKSLAEYRAALGCGL